jgi:hypothetical protein
MVIHGHSEVLKLKNLKITSFEIEVKENVTPSGTWVNLML